MSASIKSIIILLTPPALFFAILLGSEWLADNFDFIPYISEGLLLLLFIVSVVLSTYFLHKYWWRSGLVWKFSILGVFIVGAFIMSNMRDNVGHPSGGNAAIKGNLAGIRIQAARYAAAHDGKFGDANIRTTLCEEAQKQGANLFQEKIISEAMLAARNANGSRSLFCALQLDGESTQVFYDEKNTRDSKSILVKGSWAVSSPLRSSPDQYWCVDSTGTMRVVPYHITEARCPEGVAR
ncbi:MAG: hypothetical protein EXS68_01570 [Candidatus Ryanbacteria bacterium]|nr:hypothetical protein [Candidatus Ryanbacteria bacterium]